jgi:Cytochrome c554 and c-prime
LGVRGLHAVPSLSLVTPHVIAVPARIGVTMINYFVTRRVLTCLLYFAGLFTTAPAIVAADEAPRNIGRTSCATATCHGGVIGSGPAWHSSANVWESRDPHVAAGEVLLSKLSLRIVSALEPAASDSEEVFLRALQTRCVSCHAPEAVSGPLATAAASELKSVRAALAVGVSCEACHGAASIWEKEHTRMDWNPRMDWKPNQRFSTASGMLDTESLLARTDNCSRCHVGSRTADGQIRDMNHDMIAAGHPALYFDMLRYQARLPAHWDAATESLASLLPRQLPKSVEALRTRVLLAALRLSDERRAESARTFKPELSEYAELSEYDCAACHHGLDFDSRRQQRGSTGTPLWQPWYTAGRKLEISREQLRLDQPQLGQMLHSLESSIVQRSESLMQTPETDLQSHIKSLLSGSQPDCRIDYCSAAAWLDQIEVAGQSIARQENSDVHEQFDKLLLLMRQRVLGYQHSTPTTLEVLMPREWEQREIESFRKELILRISPAERRGSQ